MVDASAYLQRLTQVPPLPEMQGLLTAVQNDDVSVPELATLIEAVPALSARIVGIANSAFYGVSPPVNSVKQAIIRVLGLELVKQLTIGLANTASFRPELCPGFQPKRYWSSALLGAMIARRLALLVGASLGVNPDTAYLCGLLRNLGLVALAYVAPDEMNQVFSEAEVRRGASLRETERALVGIDHRMAGASLAVHLGLPEDVTTAIQHQSASDYRGPHWQLCLLVCVSAVLAESALRGDDSPPPPMDSVSALGVEQEQLNELAEAAAQEAQSVLDLSELFLAR